MTSGGLGPTADDLTAEVVGAFQGREMVLDEGLEERIGRSSSRCAERWPDLDRGAVRAANRKQAVVPRGATILEPVGTAPGLVVPPADGRGGPTVVVLPGPAARAAADVGSRARDRRRCAPRSRARPTYRQETVRLFGIPESEIAETLRARRGAGSTSTRSR